MPELNGSDIWDRLQRVMESETLVVNLPEAARLLGISRGSAYGLANQKIIPTLRLGRRLVVPKAALLKMLEDAGKVVAP